MIRLPVCKIINSNQEFVVCKLLFSVLPGFLHKKKIVLNYIFYIHSLQMRAQLFILVQIQNEMR